MNEIQERDTSCRNTFGNCHPIKNIKVLRLEEIINELSETRLGGVRGGKTSKNLGIHS